MSIFIRNARPLLTRMQGFRLIRGPSFVLPSTKQAAVRRLSTAPPSAGSTATRLVPRWYHEPPKAAAATAIALSAAAMAFRSRYDSVIVPCTNRSHLLVLSPQEERDEGEAALAELTEKYKILLVDPRNPDSVRVNLIAQRVLRAALRGLGVDDSRDAAMLRVTQERRRWRKASAPQPHTSHLRGLNLEIVLAKDDTPNVWSLPWGKMIITTGYLDRCNTDDEVAATVAHELGHIIARHSAGITSTDWLPGFLCRMLMKRNEIEADHIGILILGAAGFNPRWALVILEKSVKLAPRSVLEKIRSVHPKPEKRLQLLSQAKIMDQAWALYREATYCHGKSSRPVFSASPYTGNLPK